MHREVLNTCIHNTKEAEHVTNARRGGAEGSVMSTLHETLLFRSGYVLGCGIWNEFDVDEGSIYRPSLYQHRRRASCGG